MYVYLNLYVRGALSVGLRHTSYDITSKSNNVLSDIICLLKRLDIEKNAHGKMSTTQNSMRTQPIQKTLILSM